MPSDTFKKLTLGSVMTGPVPGVVWENQPKQNISFEPEEPKKVVSRASLRSDYKNQSRSQTNVWLIVWEPFYSNGVINIPFRTVWSKLIREGKNTNENALLYRGVDVTALSAAEWNLFESNKMVGVLPISVGRYIVLDRFEVNKPVIYVEKVAKNGKYIDVITSGFPNFNMTLKVVVFGSVHIKVMQFFNIVRNLISEGKPGRLVMYDVLNQIFATEDDIISTLQYNNTPYYTLIPKNITMSRDASENTFVNINITGTIAEIANERVI
jgi:hypothetical protein